jgi:arylsulfatase A-like enzyme
MLAYARENLPLYYGLIEALDHEFGRLMRALDELGLSDDTLVVYTSDHGNMHGSMGSMGKEQPWVEASQVPLLMRWPGRIEAGSELGMPFGAPDILPSLAGLAGLPAPGGLDGLDLSPALLGRPGAPRREAALLANHLSRAIPWPGWRGVRTERYLYARTQDKKWMLYDLQNDPFEMEDLLWEDRSLRRELDALTLELMARSGDGWA